MYWWNNELRIRHIEETVVVEIRLQESHDWSWRCSWLQSQGGQNCFRTRISGFWSRWVEANQVGHVNRRDQAELKPQRKSRFSACLSFTQALAHTQTYSCTRMQRAHQVSDDRKVWSHYHHNARYTQLYEVHLRDLYSFNLFCLISSWAWVSWYDFSTCTLTASIHW